MAKYQISARKYRPQQFDDLLGQGHITTTLINAINNDQLGQSFLFCGPRGVGKTTCARILAKVMNADDPVKLLAGKGKEKMEDIDTSLNIFELDAASNNSVDDIRELSNQVRMAPVNGKFKVYILDEVHMLSAAAFNAFLKLLEEPPPHVVFILATTEKHKIIPTILSRCQVFDFKRIGISDMVRQLEIICKTEKVKAEPEALHLIAEKADGAMRDALTIFDRLVSSTDRSITYDEVLSNLNILDYDYYFKVTDAFLKQDSTTALLIYDEIVKKGFEGEIFIQGLASHFRNLLVSKDPQMHTLLEVGANVAERYLDQGSIAPRGFLLSALTTANKCAISHKTADNKRLQIELALLKLSHIKQMIDTANFVATGATAGSAPQKKTEVGIESFKPTEPKKEEPKQASAKVTLPEATLKVEDVSPPEVNAEAEEPSSVLESIEKGDSTKAENLIKEEKYSEVKKTTQLLSKDQKEIKEAKAPIIKGLTNPGLFKMDLSLDNAEEEEKEEVPPMDQKILDDMWVKHIPKVKTKRTRTCCEEYHPKLIDGFICFAVKSSIDEAHIRTAFTAFLEKVLEKYPNQDFNLKIDVLYNEDDEEREPYTNREKYDALVEKNPKLDDLSKRLGLKIDY